MNPAAPGDHAERPDVVVAIVGVATEIGKTWVSARIVEHLRRSGVRVAARKPVQSYDPGELGSTDAELLAAAAGEQPFDVCPGHRWYATPMAPPMAADALGLGTISASTLLGELRWPIGTTIGLVETVGGVRSPMTDDADSAEFAELVEPDRTVLIADAGLGTINAVRLALQALDDRCLVYLNRYDDSDLHRRNRSWLQERDGRVTAVTIDEVCRWLLDVDAHLES